VSQEPEPEPEEPENLASSCSQFILGDKRKILSMSSVATIADLEGARGTTANRPLE
jgi:hypothetical protein